MILISSHKAKKANIALETLHSSANICGFRCHRHRSWNLSPRVFLSGLPSYNHSSRGKDDLSLLQAISRFALLPRLTSNASHGILISIVIGPLITSRVVGKCIRAHFTINIYPPALWSLALPGARSRSLETSHQNNRSELGALPYLRRKPACKIKHWGAFHWGGCEKYPAAKSASLNRHDLGNMNWLSCDSGWWIIRHRTWNMEALDSGDD